MFSDLFESSKSSRHRDTPKREVDDSEQSHNIVKRDILTDQEENEVVSITLGVRGLKVGITDREPEHVVNKRSITQESNADIRNIINELTTSTTNIFIALGILIAVTALLIMRKVKQNISNVKTKVNCEC